jgi:WD40 repeat protein
MRNGYFSLRAAPVRLASLFLFAVILTDGVLSPAAGQSKLPVQRFGVSEFRLTAKDANDRAFRFSPDGKLVAGANWKEVRLWSFPDGKLLHDFSGAIQTTCIGFTADGKVLLALEQRRMEIYRFDVASGKLLATTRLEEVEDEEGATTFRLSPDGRWLWMTEVYSHLAVWDTMTGKRQFRKEIGIGKGSGGGISDAGVLTLWDGSFVDRYDVRTGEQLSRKKIYERMGVLASNPQGTLLAGYSSNDKAIVFWDTVEDKQVGGKIPVADKHKRELRDAALSADGRRFVFGLFQDQWLWNRKVAVFDVETGNLISSFDPPGMYSLEQPEISPDGRYVFLAGGRSVFTPVDTTTGKLLREVPDHILGVERFSFTPDGQTLLVGSRDKRQAWNVESGKPGPAFEIWYHSPHIVAVNNNSALVSGIKGGGIRLQSIASGAVEREYETATGKYFSEIQLSVDGKTFVGMESMQSGHIRRWNVADGKVVSERKMPVVDFHRSVEFSKMIRGLTLGGSRVIRLEQVVPASKRADGSIDWGKMELVLEEWAGGLVTNRLPVPAMGRFAFADNGDGTLFAAVMSDAQNPPSYGEMWGSTHLLVWDVATGWERLRIDREMHSYFDAFALVAISRDGRLAATVSERDRVEIWNGFNGYKLDGFDAGCDVSVIAFSRDGTKLATGHADGSVYLWSTRAAWDQTVLRRRMNQKIAQQYWKDLAGEGRKPALAWQALLGSPEQAVEMLKINLKQVASAKGIAGALENVIVPLPEEGQEPLDAPTPVPPMMIALQQALEKATSDEARNHYKQLLDTASRPMSPEMRRPILGVLLAEQIDTTESRKLIEEIAAGAAGAFETQVAKSALVRIRLRENTSDNTAHE